MVEAHSKVYGLGWSEGGGAERDNATGGEEQDCTERSGRQRCKKRRRCGLWMYRECKTEMREKDYGGGEMSRLWFRAGGARTNCLEVWN